MSNDRNLGHLEQVMEVLNNRAKTWNLVTISRINKSLDREILSQAIDMIQYRHPRLNSRIINSNNHLRFQTEGTAKIALHIVNKLDNEQWQEVVNDEMNKKIDSSQNLLRVVLIHILNDNHISYLITTVHHAIADGTFSIQLHSQIFTYYQKVVSGDLINPVNILPPIPPIKKLLPQWTKGFRGRINSILFLLQLAFEKIWHRPETLGFQKYVPIAKRHCNIIHRQLNPDFTQQFVNRCRQESTTVNSALCAAMMFTVGRKIIKLNSKDVRVNCLSYLDLRRRLKPAIDEEHPAVLATSLMGFHTIKTNTSFWELARQVKKKLDAGIKQGDIFKTVLIVKQLIDFCFIFPKQVAATVSVSNIGKVNIPKVYGEFELEEISFAASHALYAGVFVLHAATFQEKMLLNFVFSQPSISQQIMEELVNNFMSCVFDVCHFNLDMSFIS
ncbi:phthiocerol/phthiodiolone dimycocerosyl transferase family protein [Cylindrospermum sp. FACHB-282]|uniref:phthiocerol/phthiodiolone dimycocerosyl transferase family protein n=1 Tax=Cylindrospermum sp. FACHB-282 TaxID=2692794 RepID=UPI00168437FC|nr:condensation domain-containing protein [Cylindrospermum sp. FACHB-282]MBD2387198.1 alcohol acetyltransferase [Cylindrospermum sp. FACHB-282]